MDEKDRAGDYDISTTKEYKNRTLDILNILRGELYPYSDTYTNDEESGIRPISTLIKDFDKPIDLDDYICQTVMPYGLAAHLLVSEDPSVAQFMNGRYEELKALLARGNPAVSEDIVDVYSGYYPYNDHSRW